MTNLQAAFLTALGVSIGDKVKIVRDVPKGEQGNEIASTSYTRHRVGKIFPIQDISGDAVQLDGFWYAPTALDAIPGVEIELADGHTLRKESETYTEVESGESFSISNYSLALIEQLLAPIKDTTGYMPIIKIGCVEFNTEDIHEMRTS